MHTNYRRKKKTRSGYYGWRRYCRIRSLRFWKQESSSARRMEVSKALASERYERIPTKYRRDILWHVF